jgi:hypothetical protein
MTPSESGRGAFGTVEERPSEEDDTLEGARKTRQACDAKEQSGPLFSDLRNADFICCRGKQGGLRNIMPTDAGVVPLQFGE